MTELAAGLTILRAGLSRTLNCYLLANVLPDGVEVPAARSRTPATRLTAATGRPGQTA